MAAVSFVPSGLDPDWISFDSEKAQRNAGTVPLLLATGGLAASERPRRISHGDLSSIGLGGCCVETENPGEIGVTVEIAPVEDEQISVIGEVVYCRLLVEKPSFGIGIEFMDTDERKAELVKFVEEKTQVDDQEYWYLTQMRRTEEEKS